MDPATATRNHGLIHEAATVCFLSDASLLEHLRPSPEEVDAIFTHPLKGCLTGTVEGTDLEGLAEKGSEWWPHKEEFHVSSLPMSANQQTDKSRC